MRIHPLSPFRVLALAAFLLIGGIATQGYADIPRTMSYQGRLLDEFGAPVLNGDYDLTFKLYEVESGPDAPVWTEAQPATQVRSGLFHVLLGSSTLLSLPFDRPYWLGITVGAGSELAPRVPLAASPYSLNARNVVAGQVVKSLNGLRDDVTLTAGTNISIVPAGQTLTISATGGGGLTLPFASATSSASTLFDVTNSGTGAAGSFKVSNAANTEPALFARSTGLGPALAADGIAQVGAGTRSGEVQLYRLGVPAAMMQAITTTQGGRLQLHDEAGNQILYLAPDADGTGGYMDIRRGVGSSGFIFDGNFSNTGEPRLDVLGSSRSAAFDMSAAGDDAVTLPVDALSAVEMLDEAGVAYQADGTSTITLDGTTQTLLSRSITLPAAGYVIAIANLVGQAVHTNGASDAVVFGLGSAAGAFATDRTVALINPSPLATTTYYYPVAVQGVFSVTSGTSTVYLLGREDAGSWRATDMQLTLLYVRTAYGTVASPVAPLPGLESADVVSSGMSAAQIETERGEARAFAAARVEREFEQMRARITALERRVNAAQQAERMVDRHGASGGIQP